MREIIAKDITFTVADASCRSLWMWSHDRDDRLVVAFLDANDGPAVWQVGTDVLDGDVLSDDMRITYAGEHAYLSLDGRHEDGVDRVVEMRTPAHRLKDFSLDIKVARASENLDRELRSLTDG